MIYVKTESGKLLNLSATFPYSNPLESADLKIYLDTYGYGKVTKVSEDVRDLIDAYVCVVDGERYLCDMIVRDDGLILFAVQNDGDCKDFKLKECEKVYASVWVLGEHGEPILKPTALVNWQGRFEQL